MRVDNLECPNKRPAVGMELSRGNIKLGQELPLKASKREPELNLLKYGCIDEAGGVAVVAVIISTDRFPRKTRTDGHFVIMLLMKGKMGLISEMENIGLSVDRGSLIQQGWRSPWIKQFVVWSRACDGAALWRGWLQLIESRERRSLSPV